MSISDSVSSISVHAQDSPVKRGFFSRYNPRALSSVISNSALVFSKKLQQNIKFAEEIKSHVSRIVLFSDNYPERSAVMRAKEEAQDIEALDQAVVSSINMVRDIVDALEEENPQIFGTLQGALLVAAVVEKYTVGNCEEMSKVGLKYAYDNKASQRVEIFRIEGGNHLFLVIGRKRNSDVTNPKTWGSSAVVCDTWSGKVYPASHIFMKLENYISVEQDEQSKRLRTILEPFSASKGHRLASVVEYPGAQ
jgi:hypothetical protein